MTLPYQTGIVFGKFFPLHIGHINFIHEILKQVPVVHIVFCSETERDLQLFHASKMTRMPTITDRFKWMTEAFVHCPSIHIHHLNEDGITPYPNGWILWSQRARDLMQRENIKVDVIFSSEPQDKSFYESLFQLPVHLIDPERKQWNVSATDVRNHPEQYWAFIPPYVQTFFEPLNS